jgi:hypothetical protein
MKINIVDGLANPNSDTLQFRHFEKALNVEYIFERHFGDCPSIIGGEVNQ